MTGRQYCLGFLFSPDFVTVLMLRKAKPAWQHGRWNGVGGKLEPSETPSQAMRREFREETQLDIEDWRHFATLGGATDVRADAEAWSMDVFYGLGDTHGAQGSADEPVFPVSTFALMTGGYDPSPLGNVRWLVAMALAVAKSDERCCKFGITELEFREPRL